MSLQALLCIPPCNPLATLIPVDYCTSLNDIIPVRGSHQEALAGAVTFKMDLNPHQATNILKTLSKPFGVWNHHVNVSVIALVIAAGWLVVVVVLDLVNAVFMVTTGLKPVQGPSVVLASEKPHQMCSFPFLSVFVLAQTVLALWVKVLKRLYFAERLL